MPRLKTFKEATPKFCLSGRRWAREQPDLRTAWRTCQNGGWMAWWLNEYRGVPISVLLHIATSCGVVDQWESVVVFNVVGVPRSAQRRYADELRRLFHPSGAYRRAPARRRRQQPTNMSRKHTRKRITRVAWAQQRKNGSINRADGAWEPASSGKHGSMARDSVSGAAHSRRDV